MLSTRRDIIPEDLIDELSRLQTDSTPEPWPSIEAAVTASLGMPIEAVFSRFDPEPMAAASVAQVHRATLTDGSEVVVKVQRPTAAAVVHADIDIIERVAKRLERMSARARSIGLARLAAGFAESLRDELDYTVEMANVADVAAAAGPAVSIPLVHPELSSSIMLVMERARGVPIGSSAEILAGLGAEKRNEVARTLLGAVLDQVMASGVFHADLHPGNILLDEQGRLTLLDFGAVGRLDDATRISVAILLHAFDRADSVGATDALVDILDRPTDLDERALERDLGALLTRHAVRRSGGTSASLFLDLFRLVNRHRLGVPPQIGAAFRALATMEGTLATIAPQMDMVSEARSRSHEMVGGLLESGSVRQALEAQLLTLLPMLQRLPRRINKITEDLEAGRFGVNVRVLADPSDRSFVTGMVHQVIVTLLAAALTICAVMLLVTDGGPMLTAEVTLYSFLGLVFLFLGFALGLRALVQVFRARNQELG